jgi:hypothetical protein
MATAKCCRRQWLRFRHLQPTWFDLWLQLFLIQWSTQIQTLETLMIWPRIVQVCSLFLLFMPESSCLRVHIHTNKSFTYTCIHHICVCIYTPIHHRLIQDDCSSCWQKTYIHIHIHSYIQLSLIHTCTYKYEQWFTRARAHTHTHTQFDAASNFRAINRIISRQKVLPCQTCVLAQEKTRQNFPRNLSACHAKKEASVHHAERWPSWARVACWTCMCMYVCMYLCLCLRIVFLKLV